MVLKIKTLVWSGHDADSVFGLRYYIDVSRDNSAVLCLYDSEGSDPDFHQIGERYSGADEAKEAAQKHFEAEILKWVE